MNNRQPSVVQSLKLFFGIFMVLVYLGAALLLINNVFDWPTTTTWTIIRWFAALIFGAYGIYRGYREFKGQHTYGMRQLDTDEDDREEQYTTYAKEELDDHKIDKG